MLSVLVEREVEMFELVPEVRQRQRIVLETDRKAFHEHGLVSDTMISVCPSPALTT